MKYPIKQTIFRLNKEEYGVNQYKCTIIIIRKRREEELEKGTITTQRQSIGEIELWMRRMEVPLLQEAE